MRILLSIAGLSINVFLLIAAGGLVGVLSGLLGVGGGFLLTPILMMIGVPPTVAAASDTNAIIATSSSGVAAHFRLKNVEIKTRSRSACAAAPGAIRRPREAEKLTCQDLNPPDPPRRIPAMPRNASRFITPSRS